MKVKVSRGSVSRKREDIPEGSVSNLRVFVRIGLLMKGIKEMCL